MTTKNYLFLHKEMDLQKRDALIAEWQAEGIQVPLQYSYGFEVNATCEQAEAIYNRGDFEAYSHKAFCEAHFEKFDDQVVEHLRAWNEKVNKEYRRSKRCRPKKGRSWGADEFDPPLSATLFDPDRVKALIDRAVKNDDLPEPHDFILDDVKDPRFMNREQWQRTETLIAERFKDEHLAYNIVRLYRFMDYRYALYLFSWDWLIKLLEALAELLKEDACWEMNGKQAIGVVFIESSQPGGPVFSSTQRNQIFNEINAGLAFLANNHPGNNLSWVVDRQNVTINVANQTPSPTDNADFDQYFIFPGMGQVSYNGNTYTSDQAGINKYRENMRIRNIAEHAFVFFVTPYNATWHAYSRGKHTILLANRNNWGGHGQNDIDRIAGHEACHKYGASDEYTGSGTPCSGCGGTFGCDNIPNGNCKACNHNHIDCIMAGKGDKICGWTRAQIGWSDIFLEVHTSGDLWSGSDDWAQLDIGDRTFNLNHPDHDDREAGDVDGYAIRTTGNMPLSEIKRILIRKGPDGFAGGWKLERIKVWHHGTVICNRTTNKWLEDNDRTFTACAFDNSYVNSIKVRVTTADVWWAGTDDDVTFSMGGKTWTLDNPGNDFERGDTNTFHLDPGTGFKTASLSKVRIHKSPDGVAGGWKLKGLEVTVNSSVIYNHQSINKWLEDNHRTFEDNI